MMGFYAQIVQMFNRTNSAKPDVARKYSVLTEIIDIFIQAYNVCIHDEDATKAAFEHTFGTPNAVPRKNSVQPEIIGNMNPRFS